MSTGKLFPNLPPSSLSNCLLGLLITKKKVYNITKSGENFVQRQGLACRRTFLFNLAISTQFSSKNKKAYVTLKLTDIEKLCFELLKYSYSLQNIIQNTHEKGKRVALRRAGSMDGLSERE